MFTSTANRDIAETRAADMLIPLIRTAATIGFAIVPYSLGFVIIAVSEHLIRSIMVGDDPEMLVCDLQNQFPNHAIKLNENYDAGLAAKVVNLIEHPDKAVKLPLDIRGTDFQMHVWDALQKVPAGSTANFTFLAEHCGALNAIPAVETVCAAG
jgi:AraC family transcriptional regulator, regulatory protein of adaptative response / methylated-DNA-[protein]-cysteine methyltransferase